MRYKPYPAYRDSGVEWLGEIPTHWGLRMLKRLATMKAGHAITSQDIEPSGEYPVFGGNGVRGFTDSFTHNGTFPLIGRQGALCGCVNLASGRFWASEHAVVAQPGQRVDPHWLTGLLTAMSLNSYAESAAQPGIAVETIGSIHAPVPPIAEQRAIAAFLDRETARNDALVAKKERLIELLQEERTALITRSVTKGLDSNVPMKDSGVEWLGEVPAHWKVNRLKHLALQPDSGIQMGPFGSMLKNLSAVDTGFKLYGQENTITGDFAAGSRWITSGQYQELSEYQIKRGDIILTRKGSLGNARIVPYDIEPGIIDSDTIRVRGDDRLVSAEFLVWVLHEAQYAGEQIGSVRRGAVLGGLNTATIANLVLCVPPREEQVRLMNQVHVRQHGLELLLDRIREAIVRLKEYRAALISAAVSGKIDVRDSAA